MSAASAPGPSEPFDLDADDATLPVLRSGLERYGDVFRVPSRTRGNEGIVVFDPDAIGRVLLANRANYVKGVGIERVRVLLGNGLIVSDGAFWARQRKMMQPAFHGQVLRGFASLLEASNDACILRWQQRLDRGEPIDLTHDLSELTLEIVLRAIFGADLDRLVAQQGANPFELLTKETRRDVPFAARFRALGRHVVAIVESRRREARVEVDFLSLLMAARDDRGEPMSDRALLDELLTLVVAGHETSASTLNWAWFLLATHAHEQEKLLAGTPDHAAQVVQEAMRLYPAVWLFSRRSLQEDELAGFAIDAGSDVFVCPYLLHRHPQLWDRPDAFVPSRFDAASAQHHRFAYLPFSAGPRLCIGASFAMAEMTTHLERVSRRFRVEYLGTGEPAAEFQINLRSRGSLPLRLIARS